MSGDSKNSNELAPGDLKKRGYKKKSNTMALIDPE